MRLAADDCPTKQRHNSSKHHHATKHAAFFFCLFCLSREIDGGCSLGFIHIPHRPNRQAARPLHGAASRLRGGKQTYNVLMSVYSTVSCRSDYPVEHALPDERSPQLGSRRDEKSAPSSQEPGARRARNIVAGFAENWIDSCQQEIPRDRSRIGFFFFLCFRRFCCGNFQRALRRRLATHPALPVPVITTAARTGGRMEVKGEKKERKKLLRARR